MKMLRKKSNLMPGLNMAACCECMKTVTNIVDDMDSWKQSDCFVNYQQNKLNVTSLADRALTFIVNMQSVNEMTVVSHRW